MQVTLGGPTPHDLKRTLDDDSVSGVLVTQGLEGLTVGIEHDVNDEGVGNPDVLAFHEPLRLNVLGGLIGQNHQRILEALPGLRGGRDHQVDIRRRALVAMSGQCIAPNQQVVHAMLVERPQQQLQVVGRRRAAELVYCTRSAARSAMPCASQSASCRFASSCDLKR